MRSATAMLHALAGAPAYAGAQALASDARCWLCAYPATRGVKRIKHEGANFTSQNHCRDQGSPYVCEACAWACSWVSPPGFKNKDSASKGASLRQFTHLYDDRGYVYTNKANKPLIRRWLREPKQGAWFAAIADSGQKHILPWTPINHGHRGRVRFEEADIWLPVDATNWALMDRLIELLTLGVTKAELDRGECRPHVLTYDGVASLVRQFEADWAHERGGHWWTLALWLAQRDEERHAVIDAARKEEQHGRRARARRSGATDPRTQNRVLGRRRQGPETLGAVTRETSSGSTYDGQRAGVRDEVPARSANRAGEQGLLFRER